MKNNMIKHAGKSLSMDCTIDLPCIDALVLIFLIYSMLVITHPICFLLAL